MWQPYLLASVLGYLLGSIPTGYIVGRWHGIDIRQHGSGNIGATNVLRVLGRKPGVFVFICDALKGFLSARAAFWFASRWLTGDASRFGYVAIVGALACIVGHNFPCWLAFRGGKGIATTTGTLLGLMPLAVLISAVIWGATFFLCRYVSVASLLSALALPIIVAALNSSGLAGGGWPMFYFSLIAAALAFWRHRSNIQRLLNGTESRFGKKTPAPGS